MRPRYTFTEAVLLTAASIGVLILVGIALAVLTRP